MEVPATFAVMTPLPEPIDTMVVLLLLHVPAPAASVNVAVEDWQIPRLPETGGGRGITVSVCVV